MKDLIVIILSSALVACSGSSPPKPAPEPAADARSIHELALESFNAGRYREAIGGFERAGQLFLSIDDRHGVAAAAVSEAEVHLLLGEPAAARATLQRARNAIARSSRWRERARLLDARARIDAEPESARKILSELQDAAPDVAAQARMLVCELAIGAGDTDCVSSLPAGDALTAARIEQLRSRAALADGDGTAAALHLDRALNIYRVLAYRPGIAAAHEWGATLAVRAGERDAAVEHLKRALYLRVWIRDRAHAVENLERLAELTDVADVRERYRRWRATLLGDEDPAWETLIRELFSSR